MQTLQRKILLHFFNKDNRQTSRTERLSLALSHLGIGQTTSFEIIMVSLKPDPLLQVWIGRTIRQVLNMTPFNFMVRYKKPWIKEVSFEHEVYRYTGYPKVALF